MSLISNAVYLGGSSLLQIIEKIFSLLFDTIEPLLRIYLQIYQKNKSTPQWGVF